MSKRPPVTGQDSACVARRRASDLGESFRAVIGTLAQLIFGAAVGAEALGTHAPWVASALNIGALFVTFLAGFESDAAVAPESLRPATVLGFAGFLAPLLGCTAFARYALHWSESGAWVAGIALSATSVGVVRAVLLELRLDGTNYGKSLLAACVVSDVAAIVAFGILLAPSWYRGGVFAVTCVLLLLGIARLGAPTAGGEGRWSKGKATYVLPATLILGALGSWAVAGPVLPAYFVGAAVARAVGRDDAVIRRLRTLTNATLAPLYFICAGSFFSISGARLAWLVCAALFVAKVVAKTFALVPASRALGFTWRETGYATLMMSTGLALSTVSAVLGLSHGKVAEAEYSYLMAAIVGSAVVPAIAANVLFVPRQLLLPGSHAAASSGHESSEQN